MPGRPIAIFCCYAPDDEPWYRELKNHLGDAHLVSDVERQALCGHRARERMAQNPRPMASRFL
jgi:hypothetical protein